jgi:hypothetical protein
MTDTTSPPNLLWSARVTSAALSISERTLWAHTAPRGTIPVVRVGSRCLYDPRDLAAWIDGQKQEGGADR